LHSTQNIVTTFAGAPGYYNDIGTAARLAGRAVAYDITTNSLYMMDNYCVLRNIAANGEVTAIAGRPSAQGNVDGIGDAAKFNASTSAMAVDSTGNVYIGEANLSTYADNIRKVTPAGVVSTLPLVDANSNPFSFEAIGGMVVDGNTLYVADSYAYYVYAVNLGTNVVTVYAGSGATITQDADGTGTAASLAYPDAITVDGYHNLYVSDEEAIRKIAPGGVVTTLLTTSGPYDGVDGIAVNTFLGAIYITGNVVISELSFDTGQFTTLAGVAGTQGYGDGTGSAALFQDTSNLTMDGNGNLYTLDYDNSANETDIRKITSAGVVTTIAGTNSVYVDATGNSAAFFHPSGIANDGNGNLYVADTQNDSIRKVTYDGVVTTLAGGATQYDSGYQDGTGSAALFNNPLDLACDQSGNVYVADTNNYLIRKVTSAGVVTTLAGNPQVSGYVDATGTAAEFSSLAGIAVDNSGTASNGTIYVGDVNRIRKITSTGIVTTLAGTSATGIQTDVDASGTSAVFSTITAMVVDSSGNIFVTEPYAIRKVTPTGMVTTIAGNSTSSGSTDAQGTAARFNAIQGIAIDTNGNLYVTNSYTSTIRVIDTSGNVTTPLGSNNNTGFTDGTGNAALFFYPRAITIDQFNNIFIIDEVNYDIRLVR
jgi:sugar lactone lactonase YvrE